MASRKTKTKSFKSEWIYKEAATISHPAISNPQFHRCLIDFSFLVVQEGGTPNPFSEEKTISVDCLEVTAAQNEKRPPRKTMDAAFVIEHLRKTVRQTVLVEFKFRVRNVENLRKQEIEDKVKNSKMLLGNEPPVLHRYFFIFKEGIKHQAINRISRIFKKPYNELEYEVTDLPALFETFFKITEGG